MVVLSLGATWALLTVLQYYNLRSAHAQPVVVQRQLNWQHPIWPAQQHQVKPCLVKAVPVGALGNRLCSLLYGLYVAQTLGVECKAKNKFKELFGDDDQLEYDFRPEEEGDTIGECEGEMIVDGWLSRPGLKPSTFELQAAAAHLLHQMDPPLPRRSQLSHSTPPKTVIYLRGGDIFYEHIHAAYTQAPCSFYDRVMETLMRSSGRQSLNVSVVTQLDAAGQNPCTQYILKQYPSTLAGQPSAVADWLQLAAAENLVLSGASTFGLTAALFGAAAGLKNVFLISWTKMDLRNSTGRHKLSSHEHRNVHHTEDNFPTPLYFYPTMPTFATHRYLVHKYTDHWGRDVIKKMPSHSKTLVTAVSDKVANLMATPASTQSLTVVLACVGNSPDQLAQLIRNCWKGHKKDKKGKRVSIMKYFPIVAFVPGDWPEKIFAQLEVNDKHYVSLFTPPDATRESKQQPGSQIDSEDKPSLYRFDPQHEGSCVMPDVVPLLYVLKRNPFNTTHVWWTYAHDPAMVRHQFANGSGRMQDATMAELKSSCPKKLEDCYVSAPAQSSDLLTSMDVASFLPRGGPYSLSMWQYCKQYPQHCITR